MGWPLLFWLIPILEFAVVRNAGDPVSGFLDRLVTEKFDMMNAPQGLSLSVAAQAMWEPLKAARAQ
jgi:hypothetical protein